MSRRFLLGKCPGNRVLFYCERRKNEDSKRVGRGV
ncbi:unknown [Firmicutes bacterium CAG:646]|nr:unknown [Firmicutes bacterium CAG:646]